MEERDIEFIVCKQCDTPCYQFDMHLGKIVNAFCSMCGNDEGDEFEIPND